PPPAAPPKAPAPAAQPEAPAPAAPSSEPEKAAAASSPKAASSPTAAPAHGPDGSDERAVPEPPGNADARMTPAVRRLLREHGLSAAMIAGTGGGGRITREDVSDFVESQRTGQPVGKQNAAEGAAPAGASVTPVGPGRGAATGAATSAPAPAAAGAAPAARAAAPAAKAGPAIAFPEGAA